MKIDQESNENGVTSNENIYHKLSLLVTRYLILFLALSFAFSSVALVDLAEIGVGARSLGIGKAGVGALDDASAIFTNPAGAAWNPDLNVITMSGTMLGDINYVMMGFSEYTPVGKVGLGYLNASIGAIPITELTGSGSTAAVVQTGSAAYNSSIVYLSYSTRLSEAPGDQLYNVSLGANLKYFMQGFSDGGSSLQNATGTGMDADLGLVWKTAKWSKVGLTLNNVLPASLGGKFIWEKNNQEESLPLSVRIGSELRVLGESAFYRDPYHGVNLLVDYEIDRRENHPNLWHLGVEYAPLDMAETVVFRLGIDQKARAGETGVGVDNNLTGGLGLKFMGFTFDYAYHNYGELSENATHFFSIGYRGMAAAAEDDQATKIEVSVPIPEVVAKPKLENYKDVPDDHWAKRPIQYLASLGVMGGYPDQTFKPNQQLSRGELAVLLVRAKGFKVDVTKDSGFKDVSAKDWCLPFVNKAVERKYMTGYPDGTFKPEQKVSRAEAAIIFSRFSGLYVKPKVTEKVFPDVPEKHWASPAIAAAKLAGFFEYLGGKMFGPREYLTRAEAAEILSKTPLIKERIKKLISGG